MIALASSSISCGVRAERALSHQATRNGEKVLDAMAHLTRQQRLVLQRLLELALRLQHPLDHEHHVGPAGVILVETKRGVGLQRVRQDALAELGDLHAVADDDGVLADQVDAAHMAVEIDADAGPVQPRRHLLDMGGLASAVIALDHHPAVVLEAGEDGERHVLVEEVIGIDVRDMLVRARIGGHFKIGVDAEDLAHGYRHIRHTGAVVGSYEGHGRWEPIGRFSKGARLKRKPRSCGGLVQETHASPVCLR